MAAAVRQALERIGLLMLQDARLPSVATLVAGTIVKGSWWGHADAKAMFAVASELDDDPDVVTAKLVAGKVTFVHRRLFPALAAVGMSREPWQMDGLGLGAATLLARVDDAGPLQASGRDRGELERRLLVSARQVHTDGGAHATELMTWRMFVRARGVRERLAPAAARAALEAAAAALGATARLPWQRAGQGGGPSGETGRR